jgi:hypothetical protein
VLPLEEELLEEELLKFQKDIKAFRNAVVQIQSGAGQIPSITYESGIVGYQVIPVIQKIDSVIDGEPSQADFDFTTCRRVRRRIARIDPAERRVGQSPGRSRDRE